MNVPRTLTCCIVVVMLSAIVCSCGHKDTGIASNPAAFRTQGKQVGSEFRNSPTPTEEDQRLLAMSLSERIDYLEAKLRTKLVELYGEVPSSRPSSLKGASWVTGNEHLVQSGDYLERIDLAEVPLQWKWTLTFLERLYGDLDLNGEVSIADVTSLAMHFNQTAASPPYDPNLVNNIERNSNGDGTVNVADITPIAMNYGGELSGYNVYWRESALDTWKLIPQNETSWHLERAGESFNTPPFRAQWSATFTRESPIAVQAGYQLAVKPVDENGNEGPLSDIVQFTDILQTNESPNALLKVRDGLVWADSTTGNEPFVAIYNASGSTDTDGTIARYDYDWEGDGTYDAQNAGAFPPPHEFLIAGRYTTTVKVTDNDGAEDTDTVAVTVIGPPVIDSFTAEPITGEAPTEVTFTVVATDTDHTGISAAYFDFDGLETYFSEYGPVTPVLEDAVNYTYSAETSYEFVRDDLIGEHSKTFTSTVRVVDSEGSRTGPIQVPIVITHAVPHISLATTPNPAYIQEGEDVTFNASGSTDADGPNGKPTKYEFDFDGDGTPDEIQEYDDYYDEYGQEIQAGYGIANYPDGHPYVAAGMYTAVIRAYDADYDTCNTPLAHRAEATVDVRVYGEPVLLQNELVDDGIHPTSTWSIAEEPCIAMDINPVTGLPGVVYSAYLAVRQGENDTRPLTAPLFAEKQQGVSGWRGPEHYPLPVWFPTDANERRAYIGQQCDLMYDQIIAGGPSGDYTVYIAATINGTPAGVDQFQPVGIKLYMAKFPPWRDNPWNGSWLIKDNTVSFASPLRLVANTSARLVHYHDTQSRLMEVSSQSAFNPVIVEDSGDEAGYSHDFKSVLTQNANGRWVPHIWQTGALYSFLNSSDFLNYELKPSQGLSEWNGSPDTITGSILPEALRFIALDYFQDEYAGFLWVDSNSDLQFQRDDWQYPSPVDYGVGNWCDFDFEEGLGIPCAAYETTTTIGEDSYQQINVSVYMDDTWISIPAVDTLGLGEDSHLDLDAYNGYIYVAYAKGGSIYCSMLDFFAGNR